MNQKLQRLLGFYQEYRDERNILIYQMGKVASTTLEGSLPHAIHVHTLYGNATCPVHFRQQKHTPLLRLERLVADAARRLALQQRREKKIISIMRDPVGRNVSMYFQNLPHWLYEYIGQTDIDIREEGFEIIKAAFTETFDHFYFDRWFDMEIRRLTGIDIFSHPFDQQAGSQVIRQDGWQLLLLTTEALKHNLEVISEFCGREVTLQDSNVAENKWYAPVLQEFKQDSPLTEDYVQRLYATRTARHFYSPQTLEKFAARHLARG